MKAFKILAFSIFFGASLNAQVGFGTTSPSNDIDVESSSATATAVDINNTGGGDPKINFQLSGTSTFSMGIDNSDADKFKIGTSALETNTRFTIDASGNVGIGTSSPTEFFEVKGAAQNDGGGLVLINNTKPSSGNHYPALRVLNDRGTHSYGTVAEFRVSNTTDNDRPSILFSKGGTNNNWSVGMGCVLLGDDNFGIGYRSSYPISGFQTIYLFIGTTGNVGIGTTSPGYKLTVNGQPGANGYTAFTNYSDSRLKTNISSLDTGALSKILQLRPVSFQYNQKYLQLYPNSDLQKVHKGFIAQEIRTVFPEMVSEMKASPDSVQYLDLDVSHLQVYLVKAMQEQQTIINAQKAEMAQNAIKVAELENKMNAMLLLLNNKTELTVKQ